MILLEFAAGALYFLHVVLDECILALQLVVSALLLPVRAVAAEVKGLPESNVDWHILCFFFMWMPIGILVFSVLMLIATAFDNRSWYEARQRNHRVSYADDLNRGA